MCSEGKVEASGEATGMELINGKGRVWGKPIGSEGAVLKEEQGRGGKRMGWEGGTGCQRKVTDPERVCGIQGIESWKEERSWQEQKHTRKS